MPRISKRDALEALTKQRLVELARGFELFEVGAAQPKADFVDAVARSKRASYEKVLEALSRD